MCGGIRELDTGIVELIVNRNFIEERLHWIWSKVLFEEGRIVFLSQMPLWAIW